MKKIMKEAEQPTSRDIFPYLNDTKYKDMLKRFYHSWESQSDEFIISEAIQIYANTKDDSLKVRILELLKDTNF